MTRFLALLIAVGALGYAVASFTGDLSAPAHSSAPRVDATGRPSASPSAQPAGMPETQEVLPATTPLAPRAALLEPGDEGPKVRELQARLRQVAWFDGDVTDTYGPKTTGAVKGFQAKRGIPALGYVDRETMQRLKAMTREPTADELATGHRTPPSRRTRRSTSAA